MEYQSREDLTSGPVRPAKHNKRGCARRRALSRMILGGPEQVVRGPTGNSRVSHFDPVDRGSLHRPAVNPEEPILVSIKRGPSAMCSLGLECNL